MGGRKHPEALNDLRTQLRQAGLAHQPNRERMLARVERGMALPEPGSRRGHRSPSGPAPWARVVGVTAGLVGAFDRPATVVGDEGNYGNAQLIWRRPDGLLLGASEPRRDGIALGL